MYIPVYRETYTLLRSRIFCSLSKCLCVCVILGEIKLVKILMKMLQFLTLSFSDTEIHLYLSIK